MNSVINLFLMANEQTNKSYSHFFSLISLGVFGLLLIIFIGLHIWWTKRHQNCKKLEYVKSKSIFYFFKINIFAMFAALWGAAVISAILVLIS